MNTNILAPFVKTEDSFKFYVSGRIFEMKNNEIAEIEKADSTLASAIAAFESFDFSNSTIKWFHGPYSFLYDMSENKFMSNRSLIEGNTFSKHVLSAGMVRYEHKNKAELFESLPTLLENFIVLDFAATFEGNNNIVNVFKLNEDVYVARFNTQNRISKFFKAANANDVVSFVMEQTGESAATFLSDLLEGEALEIAANEAKLAKYQDIITFLKDQRGLLAEADKSIEEIKAADSLINEEIKLWETKIAELSA